MHTELLVRSCDVPPTEPGLTAGGRDAGTQGETAHQQLITGSDVAQPLTCIFFLLPLPAIKSSNNFSCAQVALFRDAEGEMRLVCNDEISVSQRGRPCFNP